MTEETTSHVLYAVMYGSGHCSVPWTEIDRMNTQLQKIGNVSCNLFRLSPRDFVSMRHSCKLNLGFTAFKGSGPSTDAIRH
jgi:hypothetical protein